MKCVHILKQMWWIKNVWDAFLVYTLTDSEGFTFTFAKFGFNEGLFDDKDYTSHTGK